jgi:GGDEF domain-containing protein
MCVNHLPFSLDFDEFKLVNDTFGVMSEKLCKLVRESNIVARLGGGKFAALLSAPCSRCEADRIAANLIRAVAESASGGRLLAANNR